MDLPTHKSHGDHIGLKDFPGDIIRLFVDVGFVYHCPRITIWKDPLISATRTKALGLAHKQIVKNSSMCRSAIPDCCFFPETGGESCTDITQEGIYGISWIESDAY